MDSKKLVRHAILISLTMVLTMTLKIPTIATKGYLNLGDMVIFLSALMLGKKGGFIVGSIGSSMADLLSGYTHYAPITFVVKGLEGYLAGWILETKLGKKMPIVATVVGGVFMAFGYYVAEVFLYGPIASLASLPGNLVQGLFGAVSSMILYNGIKKVDKNNLINNN